MKSVTDIQEQMIQRAKQLGAVLPVYDLIVNEDLKGLLLQKIKKNFRVLWREKVITQNFLTESFTEEELIFAGIFIDGVHETKLESVIVCGRTDVIGYSVQQAECYDSSSIQIIGGVYYAYDKSTVDALSDAVIYAYNESVVFSMYGNTVVFKRDKSSVKGKCERTVIVDCN